MRSNKNLFMKMKFVHWKDPEEADGEGGGRGDRDGEYM